MNEQLRAQYDSLYVSQEAVFNEGKPAPVVERLVELLDQDTVLDIGGGDGRNALYLAAAGHAVTVIDLSAVGLTKIDAVAAREGYAITTQVGDITTEPVNEQYGAVVLSFVLHHLPAATAKAVIAKAQLATRPGGYLVISTFGNQGGLYDRSGHTGRYYPSEAELSSVFTDWKTVLCRVSERACLAKDKAGQPLINQVVTLLLER